MSTESVSSIVAQIGETAGMVWKTLDQNGPMSLTKLVKAIPLPRDAVMQAIGWLAREDKILIDDSSRARTISLR
jgi:hypothetical protein